jgi:predicted permease
MGASTPVHFLLEHVPHLWRALRHAVRSLSRQPALAVVAVLTVSLGTAATTAVLSVRSALVVRPLPVEDPGMLHLIDEARSGAVARPFGVDAMPYRRYVAYREIVGEVFDGLAAERYRIPGGFSLTAPEGALAVNGYLVSGNYFRVLGLTPVVGRFFSDDDTPSVVLGHRFWRQRFSEDPGVVGRTVRIDSRSFVVAGVAPERFEGTTHGLPSDIWIPFEAYLDRDDTGFDGWVTVFGRLRSGVGLERARSVVTRAATTIPPVHSHTRVRGADVPGLTGLPPDAARPVANFLMLLVATGVLVLLIAGANISGMLMARGMARRREIAVRVALGAGRGRIVGQGLTEALVLFLVGGAIGIWLGGLAARAIQAVQVPVGFDVAFDLTPDLRVLVLGLLATAVVGASFGLVPSLRSARIDVVSGLRASMESAAREGHGWRLFVRAQLALSVLLLITAGLFARTLQQASRVDLGFDPDGVVLAQIDLEPHGYDPAEASAFFSELVERVRSVTGVGSAALANTVLLGPTYGRSSNDMRAVGADESTPGVNSAYSIVEPGYLATLGIPIVMGRDFTEADAPGAPAAVIVNQTLADRLWPGESPIGRRVTGGGEFEVVGVVRDGKYGYVGEPPTPYLFRASRQSPRSRMTLHVRSSLPAAGVVPEVRSIVADLDPDVAMQGVQSLSSVVGLTLFPQRFAAWMVGAFGLTGLFFAVIGVYGLLHFNVARRTREVGIRIALGADPRRVFRDLLMYGARLAGVAVFVGLVMAVLLTRLLGDLMIGVTPLDPPTFLLVGLTLMSAAVVASALPAWRATRVDPSEALRTE